MKYLVVSDIHGSGYYAKKLEDIISKECPDEIILLGDLYYHGPRNPLPKDYEPKKVAEILNSYKDKISAVRGNCDAEVDQMISEFEIKENLKLDIAGKKFSLLMVISLILTSYQMMNLMYLCMDIFIQDLLGKRTARFL